MGLINIPGFYRGKTVFITGHTGFKGAWLCRILQRFGAKVTGYALAPDACSAYGQIVNRDELDSHIADIRSFDILKKAFDKANPEIVFHLAAQPIVLTAYNNPLYTFDVNVQGTVNLLECVRLSNTVKSGIIVTTDKVYKNNEREYGYRENDVIGDTEPYAASKACAEIVSSAYFETFLKKSKIALSTVRAGNVIGGGDISQYRIIPDCVRSAKKSEPVTVRNKYSVRPYQHVLDPLFAYLLIAMNQLEDVSLSGNYNIGPNEEGCVSTETLVNLFCDEWGNNQTWKWNEDASAANPRESSLLKLDCAKMRSTFDWQPRWLIKTAVAKTIEWERSDHKQYTADSQIDEFLKEGA